VLSASAFAQLKIGVIASSTGATAVVGIPQKNSAALLPKKIGDYAVEYFVFDDASDATQSVILVKKLIAEQKIDALIGPSGSPNSVSVVPIVAEAGTPMLAPVGATAVVLPMDDKKRWGVQTTAERRAQSPSARRSHGQERRQDSVGMIGFNDPYGDNWYAVFARRRSRPGIKVVANEKFLRTDASVTGPSGKAVGGKARRSLVAAAGGPTVLPHVHRSSMPVYKGRIYHNAWCGNAEFF
jgi:branched-chain amino acid transport system substrate-binding protein